MNQSINRYRDAIIAFLRDIIAIPSYDSNIREVAARVECELRVCWLCHHPTTRREK